MNTPDPGSLPDSVMHSRAIERLITGRPTSDGAGVKLTRVIGGALQQRLDPFLMLDAFRSEDAADYIGGFPDHPHRGFETVTYLIAGRMRHRDSAGNQGLLDSGGMQWMLAGRGVIHSEMPEQEDGALEGFQLWLNLPARDKLTTPAYRDVQSGDIPEFTTDSGTRVRVLLGESHGVSGAVRRPVTEPLLLDIHLPAGVAYSQTLPASHHACLYVYRGTVAVGGEAVADQQLAILAQSATADGVTVSADAQARVLLIAGQPLHEPIAQHGPFVMNTEAELRQAVADYQSGRLAAP
jgi:redox-sensitive bicupin YhaK (pirin superfamily)